jgi:arsenite-transporting ATPase
VAWAVAAAQAGQRVLLVSSDPAPSAGDALRQPLGPSPRRVAGTRGRLHAVEIDAPKALKRWLDPRRAPLEEIVLRGTWLDRDDVSVLLGLSLPGIDEIAALIEIGRLGRSGRYDAIVVDTAPTGHALRMLRTPALIQGLAAVFDRMQGKHRAIVAALRGRWTPEASDVLIASLDDEGRALAALLGDRQRTAMSWVTLPEPMAVAETADALAELTRLHMPVDTLIVNRLTPPPDRPCRWCRARRRFEGEALVALQPHLQAAGSPRLATVASRGTEPRGIAQLKSIAADMAGRASLPGLQPRTAGPRAVVTGRPPDGNRAAVTEDQHGLSLLMFGGKGGVGKTTCAAAAAIAAAAARPRRSVLLLSADPAHSLADVLGVPLGDAPRQVAGAPANLRARELDALARFESMKARYGEAIDGLFDRLVRTSGFEVSADRQAMRDLMELAPPGLDELIAIVEVSEALESASDPEPLVVLDTAPTGHALRLLEMPALVHDWVKALMAILLKYQPVTGVGELGSMLVQMSQGLGRLRARLTDPSRTAFTAVTLPAMLPVAETARLLKRLRALRIRVPAVVVNAVGAGTCTRCASALREQRRAVAAIQSASRRGASHTVVIAPARVPPPTGPSSLRDWRREWKSPGVGK